jgi:hypothetical protein
MLLYIVISILYFFISLLSRPLLFRTIPPEFRGWLESNGNSTPLIITALESLVWPLMLPVRLVVLFYSRRTWRRYIDRFHRS